MNIIAFDTSTNDRISVAISNGQSIISCLTDNRSAKQAEMLIPMIEEAMKKASINYENIQYLGVSSGPGSFTGIRIGLAAAKSLAFSAKIKAIAVNNFEIAFNYVKKKVSNYDDIIVLINAYRGQFYLQKFDKIGNSTVPKIFSSLEVIEIFKNIKHNTVCVGKDLEPIYKDISIIPNVTILPRFPRINALHICHIIKDMVKSNDMFACSANNLLEPLYIRPPDAKPNIAQ